MGFIVRIMGANQIWALQTIGRGLNNYEENTNLLARLVCFVSDIASLTLNRDNYSPIK